DHLPEYFFIIEIRKPFQMISETDLNLYSFTSTATIFGPNKSVICIFIEIH
ncbi:hypothetical protein HMPREF3040_05493, partial [Escherichia coli]